MRPIALFLVLLTGIFFNGCASRYDQPPKPMIIEQAFFMCVNCGSLIGGVFGKGPMKRFQAESAPRCIHDWQRIQRNEFCAQARDGLKVDWSKEIPYWNAQ